ncbi:PREDICTED: monocarboxylate transporter 10 isoform X1 [Polistes canadensis]|uniref:monocarboxylate transporter 10 isoform X1 n=1 Tax=Polistes canadensis TaxID=91411 RepID=UPI000718F00B|nr:PREDICTED: monocarboxylate transporter 10 isoform X1 [Polistes canadensis]XP_014616380.1 PREDICTED: monocarboxylate transporter 10 isoform X1 [Polistes canadensis]XP_014616381.1 PREDICTED: monocarboxylate transporter 10 isoform X1 [Polistes canadensis]XP_014616382.1 PREDICTED: monocarboxylate transporter 10 isoform X1 [Polistes canadensis]XP_014616383.1 PREDICTED: monocarboxylate transporter 10 isoform X1 [Polistes canadensis]XP_014616384.1 PREDICTED: monocarboxylate transporter 10 isoform 
MTVTDNVQDKRNANLYVLSNNSLEQEYGRTKQKLTNTNESLEAANVQGNSDEFVEPCPETKLISSEEEPELIISNDSKSNRLKKIESEESLAKTNWQEDVEANNTDINIPPDGGLRAWMIMLASFFINGILFSVINTYSLIYLELQRKLMEAGETEVSSKASLVGSLTIGTTFFLSPVAGILTDKIGIQMTTFLGGAIASSGMLLSSMLSDKVELLYLTYGVMYGLGASLAYTPSLVILGHYFKKYLGLVNGIVTAGSSLFTTLVPYLMETLLRHFGLEGTFRSLAALTSIVMVCALLFKPIPLKKSPQYRTTQTTKFQDRLKEVINLSIWKRKRYVVWAISIPLALFGYFVPYVHIGKFVATTFKGSDGKLPVMCIGITSGIGRLIFGYIADLPKVNRILLQQVSFLSIGMLTMLLTVTPSFKILLIISLSMGLFDGCFISLLGPIAFDICGREGATQAIGFLLGMCSIPLTVGPPIAGLLYDHTGSYDLPFLLAGVPPIIGALSMFLIKCVKETDSENDADSITEDPTAKSTCQNGMAKANLLSSSFVTTTRRDYGLHKDKTRIKKYLYIQTEYGSKGMLTIKSNKNGSSGDYWQNSRCSEKTPLLFDKNQILLSRTSFLQRKEQSSMLLTL